MAKCWAAKKNVESNNSDQKVLINNSTTTQSFKTPQVQTTTLQSNAKTEILFTQKLDNENEINEISELFEYKNYDVKLKLKEFKKIAAPNSHYKDYENCKIHFKNWLRKNPPEIKRMVY